MRNRAAIQIEIGRTGDIGELTLSVIGGVVAVIAEIVAQTDIAFQQVLVEIAVFVFRPHQQFEFAAQACAGFFAHGFKLMLNFLQLAVRPGASGQFSETTALGGQPVPFVFGHELEFRAVLGAFLTRCQVQGGHDGGPRIDIRRKQVRPTGHGVQQGRLARFHLSQNRDAGFEIGKFVLQALHRAARAFAREIGKRFQCLFDFGCPACEIAQVFHARRQIARTGGGQEPGCVIYFSFDVHSASGVGLGETDGQAWLRHPYHPPAFNI